MWCRVPTEVRAPAVLLSRACGSRWDRRGRPQPARRRRDRPPYEQLLAEIAELGYVGVGRKYGVSDNAVRKWRLAYEREGAGDEATEAQAAAASASTSRSMRTRPA